MPEHKDSDLVRKAQEKLDKILRTEESYEVSINREVYDAAAEGASQKKIDKKDKEQQDTEIHNLRVKMMKNLTNIVIVWCVAVLTLVCAAGCSYSQFTISESVLLALIGSTPANLFGAFMIGAKWLFNDKGGK